MTERWWIGVLVTVALGCGGEGGVSDAVVTLCASACEDLASYDECSDDQQACIADCEAVASSYDEECGVCLAQSSTSYASDACSDNYPGCEDQITCDYTIAAVGDCSSACE